MENIFIKLFKKSSIENIGIILFLSGIFFLPSTLLFGVSFLLPAAIMGSFLQQKSFFKDKWNYPFLIFGLLILISSLLQNFILTNPYDEIWDPKLSLIGLGNWLPFLWLFWGFQPYLNTRLKREKFALFLTAGTLPVFVTGFGQYFFNWHGPFETLNGLIIWYQRPIDDPGGLSGLFNNQNYTGSWLNFVWPFSLALFLDKSNIFLKKIFAFSFLFSIGLANFLTYSRNAWIGLITTLPLILGKKGITMFVYLLSIIIFLYLLLSFFSYFFTSEIQNSLLNIPMKIYLEFSNKGYNTINSQRLEIYLSALNLIMINPIFGIGAASFSSIYFLETNLWKGHSHNLFFELAISYGLPATLIFFIAVFTIILLSGRLLIIRNPDNNISLIDRAFWTAIVVFILSQLFDIQYFDGKISITAWILISGLKCIITESSYKTVK
ncbi:MAG: O-antigen polymerase [Flavobacteriales bacterium]|jgi:O-antigen ligase|nr:O-antigen polymerase [Flavobacteriales bacterium]|tara:strand:+ start:65 stop:1375 length:1311 start_codon:yes stop_codon:yes gene_type:complete